MHVQVEMIPHTYVLRRYSKEAKSDVNFDRRDRPIAGLDGVKLSNRTKVLSLDAQQLVKWGRRSSVAFERATSVMKGLRNCHARKFTNNFRTDLCIKSSSRNQPRYTN